ncbi:glycogen debranching N-terminal domain-containing protein [Streptomyces sp. NPDC048717]|uniref:glycogen debranching N-terminal domain-containing protein n=1 Tax=Streptomyces sp. NPDC048717 TaxID=3154928 RepID=UPI003416A1E5
MATSPAQAPGPSVGRPPRTGNPSPGPGNGAARPTDLPATHDTLIGVALPALAISPRHGQLTGNGLEGVFLSGRRLLARCVLRVAGRAPIPLHSRAITADQAEFLGVLRAPGDTGPDPGLAVERVRSADGTERITLRSSASRPLRIPVEITLGTDLADLRAVGSGRPGPELAAAVHGTGLRWTADDGAAVAVLADPPPREALATAGLLRWETELAPGAGFVLTLRLRADRTPHHSGQGPGGQGPGPGAGAGFGPGAGGRVGGHVLADAVAEGDDARLGLLLRASVADLRALLQRDPAHPADVHLAAGVPWRCGPVTAEALWAARMALPLGTRLAATTLRAVARSQCGGTGPDSGRMRGPLRDAGPHLPPRCTGVEATLAFPVVLAEARRWGLADQDLAELLPVAERCLGWLRGALDGHGFVPDPWPTGPARAETQAHAHRAALLGADLLDACGRPGGDAWREWAWALRERFRARFWLDDPSGGRPVLALTSDGRPLCQLGGWAAHLLDTGLAEEGWHAPGLLDRARTERLAHLLVTPALDSGWGLRGLGAKEQGHNPFGHRSGAVRVHETAVAVAGLAAAGHESEAVGLLRGLLDAADAFDHRLPEMFAGHRRTPGVAPVAHPAACRPAAVAAAAGVHLVTTLVGVCPDVPGRTVALHPLRSAPFGEVRLSGLVVAGEPFAARSGRFGLGMVEEAASGLQLGV